MRIDARVELLVLDPVEDARQPVAAGAEQLVEAFAVLRREDLRQVLMAHGADRVGGRDSVSDEAVAKASVDADQRSIVGGKGSLVSEIVDREDGRRAAQGRPVRSSPRVL